MIYRILDRFLLISRVFIWLQQSWVSWSLMFILEGPVGDTPIK